MSYISVPSLAHEVILKRLKRLGDPVPPGALEARSGIRGLSLATLDSFELSVSPVRPIVRTISGLGGRRQLAALWSLRPAGARSGRVGWWERRGWASS